MPEIVFGRNEPGLIHQHQMLELALTQASDAPRSGTAITGGAQHALQTAGLRE